MKVSELMKKAVVIDDHATLKQAAKIMSHKGIGSLIIVKGKKINGIITERDIIKNISKLNSKVNSVMSKNVITIESETDTSKAAEIMASHKIKRLPVIEKKKLIGLISITDLIVHSSEAPEGEFIFN